MAAKEKAVVDHTAISGASPPIASESSFVASIASALGKSSVGETSKSDPFATVVTGKEFSPPRILAYGMDGIGKSTFASQAPNPIFIQTEEGNKQIGSARFPRATSYREFLERLNAVASSDHKYQTLVIDGVSGLEALIFEEVARSAGKANIDLVGGGFDKGQKLAMTQWNEVVSLLEITWKRGMAVILLAHSRPEDIGDPENPMAKQSAPAMHRKTSGELIRRWVDATFFMTRRMTVKKEGQGAMEKTIAIPVGADGGERIIRTTWTPGAVAKNRYDMPSEIPFPRDGAWNSVMSHITAFYSQKG